MKKGPALKARENHYQWQLEAEEEVRSIPHPKKWFMLLEWVTALGTLQFLYQKTHSTYLRILYWASYFVLFGFLQRVIFTLRIQRYLPFASSKSGISILTFLLAVISTAVVYLFANKLVEDITVGLALN